MYDVIYFNAWSDIICTAAKLLHGTSASLSPRGQRRENGGLGLRHCISALFRGCFKKSFSSCMSCLLPCSCVSLAAEPAALQGQINKAALRFGT